MHVHEPAPFWRENMVGAVIVLCVFRENIDLEILKNKTSTTIRVRDFLSDKLSSRVNQRHFGGKSGSRCHYAMCFSENVKVAGIRSLIIL